MTQSLSTKIGNVPRVSGARRKEGNISRITQRIAAILALTVSLLVPLGYFAVSYQYVKGSLETEAEINGRIVSEVIGSNPEMWRYEQVRLRELLSSRPREGHAETRRVLDEKGGLVAESSNSLQAPVIVSSSKLYESGRIAGSIEISRSLRPLLQRTGLIALAGMALGLIFFQLLPYRAIQMAEKRLEDALEFLNKVMEGSTNAIAVLGPDGTIRMANHRLSDICGIPGDELVGFSKDDLFSGEALARIENGINAVLEDGAEIIVFETIIVARNGASVTINCGLTPLSQEGSLAGVIMSIEDITERKKYEEQLERYSKELEESNAELKSFAYIVSHDLRAPLVNIKGFASELNSSVAALGRAFEGVSGLLDAKTRNEIRLAFEEDLPEALDFINSSVVRMDSLINSILKLSRLGYRELKAQQLDLAEMVQDILKTMTHQLEQSRTQVFVGSLPYLEADRMAMEQVLGNLLDNAVKYLDPARPGILEISGESGDGEITFHVRDNGRGIAPADTTRIFEIFRRAGRQDVQGEGMGLAYVKTLVRRLGGQIWCTSEPGAGSTFSFTIPIA